MSETEDTSGYQRAADYLLALSEEMATAMNEAGEFLQRLQEAEVPPPAVTPGWRDSVWLLWGKEAGGASFQVIVGRRRGEVDVVGEAKTSRPRPLPTEEAIEWVKARAGQ